MDQSLKQRLIGVTIVVALVVIFAPMLFDETEQKPGSGMPSLPADVLEKPLELPKSAEDLAPKEEEKESAREPAGYRIIPLNDEPSPKPPQTPATPPAAAVEEGMQEPPMPEEAEPDAQAETPPPAAPHRKPGANEPAVRKPPVKPPLMAPALTDTPNKPHTQAPAKLPETAPEPKKPKRPATALAPSKPAEPPRTAKPAAEDTPAADIKPATPPAKPKAKIYTPSTKKTAQAEKPPAVEPDAPVESTPPKPPVAKPAPVKPAQPKPVEQKPALPKPAQTAKPPAQPPATNKPAPQPNAGTGAASSWSVQTGSFTSEAKARELVDKLRQSRLPAYLETVNGAKGATYRVRVGSEADRARAEQLQKQIQSEIGIKGFVVPKP